MGTEPLFAKIVDIPDQLTFNPYPPPFKPKVDSSHMEPVQDGLLAYYNAIAPQADANVEKRLETEPYQWPYCGSAP